MRSAEAITASAVERILDDVFAKLGLVCGDEPKPRPKTQADVIADLLVSRSGRVVRMDELRAAIGGVSRSGLFVVMMKVRDALAGQWSVISIRGVGYKVVPE